MSGRHGGVSSGRGAAADAAMEPEPREPLRSVFLHTLCPQRPWVPALGRVGTDPSPCVCPKRESRGCIFSIQSLAWPHP